MIDDVRLSDESKIVICLANAQLQLHRKIGLSIVKLNTSIVLEGPMSE